MPSYGRQLSGATVGQPLAVSVDGAPRWKTGGITIDWSTVPAVTGDTTLGDGTVIPDGAKGLEYGTILCQITASGAYGPYDAGASDGRETLAPGNCFVLNQSVLEQAPLGLNAYASAHPGVIFGGKVWLARLKVGGSGQPTLAALLAVLPQLQPVQV